MIRNNQFLLKTIGEHTYLLPAGQSAADMQKAITLNETGIFIWNLLEQELDLDVLVHKCAEEYDFAFNDPEVFDMVSEFVHEMTVRHVIIRNEFRFGIHSPFVKSLSIGKLTCNLYGSDDYYHGNLDSFVCEPVELPDQYVEVLLKAPAKENGTILLRNDTLWVIDTPNKYILLFPELMAIREVHLQKDGSVVQIYCHAMDSELLRENIFQVYRHAFAYLAQLHDMVILHSASVCYENSAILFSAASGVGKSTQAELWKKELGAPILNGDLNLVEVTADGAIIHGLPWCGTSETFANASCPVRAVLFLKQGPVDVCVPLNPEQKIIQFCHRLISPAWTTEQLERNYAFAEKLITHITMGGLSCTPTANAVITAKNFMDKQ